MWYSVRILFESHVDDGRTEAPLCDEVLKLVQADSMHEASAKSRAIATTDETRYKNHDGASVKWTFVDVLEVQELSEESLYDGVEVYSRLFWKSAVRE